MAHPSSRALAALRAATAARHAALESGLRIAAPGAGRREYTDHVAALWSWMRPIEASLWSGPWPARVEAPARAVKVGWLATDLEAARRDGYAASIHDAPPPAPCLDSLAARMGLAYVIEGSLLGAQVLRRRLAPVLAPWPMRWLQGYGEEGGRRWAAFLDALAAQVATPREIEAACESACGAFETLSGLMRLHEGAR